ncbi:MAG: hypothetical protein QM756_32705 [Polyangiaceae bacterium]
MTISRRAKLLLCHCSLLAACSGSGGDAGTTATQFVPVAESFRGYHSWPSFDVTAEAVVVGIHDGSTVTAYMNQLPATGSAEFEQGTMIVKEAVGGTMEHELFAMARRGGNFNSVGAVGWEWFELENLADGNDGVKVVWRGFGPPIGEVYGGDPNSTCNTCHKACTGSVCSSPLQLANF